MLHNLYQVFLYELRRNFRRKGYLFATFGIPVLLFVGMFLFNVLAQQATGGEDAVPDPADITAQFEGIESAGYIDQSGLFTTVPESLSDRITRFESVEAAREAMQAGEVDVFYVIADDYLETGTVTLHMPGIQLNFLNSNPIEALIQRTLAGEVDAQILERLRDTATYQEFNLQRGAETDAASREDADFLMLYVFTITFLLALFMTNAYLMQTVIEEKENRLIEILISTVRPFELLTGKILALGILGILQMIVWVSAILIALRVALALPAMETLTVLFNIQIRWEVLPVMLVYFVFGYLFFAALYAAVGAISNSMREGPQYAVFFTLPAVLPFYVFALFIEAPNGTLPVVLSMIPITAPIAMLMRVSIASVPVIEIALSVGLLIVAMLAAMWLAGRIFRVQTLLAGQTPKLRDLARLVRG